MHCVILAGGTVSPEDPLYAYTNGRPKALLDMAGRTMLERVVDALQGCREVENILVVGLPEDVVAQYSLSFQRPVSFLPDQGSMVGNMLASGDWYREHFPGTNVVVGCSADIPTLTAAIVDELIERCRPWDSAVYYIFVTRDVLEKRFPDSHRTYSRIGGLEVAGGDMAIARLDVVVERRELLESLTNLRKHPWQIARLVGLKTLLKFLLRRLTFDDIETTATRLVGRPVKIILMDRAELAMDADKPFQVDMLRADLMRQATD